ncbi:uncharacterized protein STEHIDRAFT_154872 [Stereum hirsutum FP-91666 SS1]|uniref:uncharacterized protein n=1 Tax=Stereum hirsutum (strain FP-91666) TaxID=721885 RepID=UPI000440D6A9|nr:uncharacterized protein STEHIDRAFT_154872 [Stereum hirsutum FP-91666 SS1]EIM89192.1 hypothetical protein STEHIDRAFT_154872 [Stereum hirsutum FP-91666 SS1]
MLSRRLHAQIFKNVSFPSPEAPFVRIAQDHLESHGLDRTQGSVLPDTSFTLPPLTGPDLSSHFHRIGSACSHPYLSLARSLASSTLPPCPRPEHFEIRSGWTKYYYEEDGSSYSEAVPWPVHEGVPEEALVFDVETLPEYGPYAVMACAASKNGWYAWISPWLMGETEEKEQLIPLGDREVPRVVVGHNVSYDRARVKEEYHVEGSKNRFLDTMALHVAVKGISSHQRPAWMQYRKSKLKERERKEEAFEAVVQLLNDIDRMLEEEKDEAKVEELRSEQTAMRESLSQMLAGQSEDADASEEQEEEISSKRWEDITSANSLADVAKLHCGIEVDKEIRNDFMTHTPEEIMANVQDYLTYCASDVNVTHSVYAKVLPDFLDACPNPVSFAGILTMGSSFLTVNQEWERYIENAERTYRELDTKVKERLLELAVEAKDMMEGEQWRDDVWLSQLDWTPKIAGPSRGVYPPEQPTSDSPPSELEVLPPQLVAPSVDKIPTWYHQILHEGPLFPTFINRNLPFLLKLSFDGHPVQYTTTDGWHYVVNGEVSRFGKAGKSRGLLTKTNFSHFESGRLVSDDDELTALARDVADGQKSLETEQRLIRLANDVYEQTQVDETLCESDPWLKQLDWSSKIVKPTSNDPATTITTEDDIPTPPKRKKAAKPPKPPQVYWPKWYWELTKPKKGCAPGTIDITTRSRVTPILLKLSWKDCPLFHSREHGWTYRISPSPSSTPSDDSGSISPPPPKSRQTPLSFHDPSDETLMQMSLQGGFTFHKVPHKDGESANVGSPLGKTFIKFSQDGTLKSPGDLANSALDMNAQCSYWISARDRVLKQMVVWEREGGMGMKVADSGVEGEQEKEKWGIIIPQVITMGTVTRRAIEKTWLTASNSKKNRVGSELKAMVRAPDGYAIVGADVDSEELWISSVMGDAQFGLHGATAIGWMTLEGTKAAGTDLHSKTASILGISRDQAKVFNYSRIYGAGMRHAVLLLLQANSGMLPEEAQKLAENLYASTKGKNTHRQDIFGRKFWFGGTESFVFNKLEEIALSDRPQTPALGCGVTYALSKEYLPAEFGSDYMPSRINWVVQSSGVDYLHLLIVSMDHLIQKYDIQARYLISVHDELRYLVKKEDKYRLALALQVANLWTRSMFAYRLGMDDLPQGVAFFSAVDVDFVLRKETDMTCVTPSQPVPIPPGESLNVEQVLAKTKGGSLWADGRPMEAEGTGMGLGSMSEAEAKEWEKWGEGYVEQDCLQHRAHSAEFLRAQATQEFEEIKHLAQLVSGEKYVGGIGGGKRSGKKGKGGGKKEKAKVKPVGNGEGIDEAEEYYRELSMLAGSQAHHLHGTRSAGGRPQSQAVRATV